MENIFLELIHYRRVEFQRSSVFKYAHIIVRTDTIWATVSPKASIECCYKANPIPFSVPSTRCVKYSVIIERIRIFLLNITVIKNLSFQTTLFRRVTVILLSSYVCKETSGYHFDVHKDFWFTSISNNLKNFMSFLQA